jgi:GMP synthase-like glutamine amidotransferase
MKIGLLLCDHIAENFLEIGGDYPDYFARLFHRWQGAIEWRLYDLRNGDHPRSPRECDAWMTTGSRASAYDEEERTAEGIRAVDCRRGATAGRDLLWPPGDG